MKYNDVDALDIFDSMKLIETLEDLGWTDERIVSACKCIIKLDEAIDKTLKVKLRLL